MAVLGMKLKEKRRDVIFQMIQDSGSEGVSMKEIKNYFQFQTQFLSNLVRDLKRTGAIYEKEGRYYV